MLGMKERERGGQDKVYLERGAETSDMRIDLQASHLADGQSLRPPVGSMGGGPAADKTASSGDHSLTAAARRAAQAGPGSVYADPIRGRPSGGCSTMASRHGERPSQRQTPAAPVARSRTPGPARHPNGSRPQNPCQGRGMVGSCDRRMASEERGDERV